jgi:hypothetical protein
MFWPLLMITSFLLQAADTILKVHAQLLSLNPAKSYLPQANCIIQIHYFLPMQEIIFLDAQKQLKVYNMFN